MPARGRGGRAAQRDRAAQRRAPTADAADRWRRRRRGIETLFDQLGRPRDGHRKKWSDRLIAAVCPRSCYLGHARRPGGTRYAMVRDLRANGIGPEVIAEIFDDMGWCEKAGSTRRGGAAVVRARADVRGILKKLERDPGRMDGAWDCNYSVRR
jgi:hypothetical protein